jgi:hypothetical protein
VNFDPHGGDFGADAEQFFDDDLEHPFGDGVGERAG